MKEERLAILSLIEKGVINVEEAERLLKTMSDLASKDKETTFSKAGENLNNFAKNAAKKAEKIINDAKPAVKKAVDDATPKVKKLGEKATEFTTKIINKNKTEEVDESDFEKDVNIIPVESGQNDNTNNIQENCGEKEQ